MDDQDVLILLSSQVDNDVLQSLSRTPIWSKMSKFAADQYFWYLRTQNLVQVELKQRPGEDWKAAYYALDSSWRETNKFSDEVVASTLAVRILFELGKNPALGRNSAIRAACGSGRTEVVQLLLSDSRVEPGSSANYAIRVACYKGYADIVSLLLADERVDPQVDDNYPIRTAAERGNEAVVKILLEDGRADPSAANNAAVVLAAWHCHPSILSLLLSDNRVILGEEIDAALDHAYELGREDIVDLLERRE